VVETASSSPTATEPSAKFLFDEFGEPETGTGTSSAGRFGWLGGKQRRTELSSGVIQMGARSYIPSLGRFLTPDPVPGGSANPYDYANQDPVNGFDLEGTCASKKQCRAAAAREKARDERRLKRIRALEAQSRRESARQTSTAQSLFSELGIHLPWEKQVNEAEEGLQNALNAGFGKSCAEKAETFGFVSGTATAGKLAAKRATTLAARKIAGVFSDIADGGALLGLAFGIAAVTHVC
jgi:RHS repeat-associated protein